MPVNSELLDHYRKLIQEMEEDMIALVEGRVGTYDITSTGRTVTTQKSIADIRSRIEELRQIVKAYERRSG